MLQHSAFTSDLLQCPFFLATVLLSFLEIQEQLATLLILERGKVKLLLSPVQGAVGEAVGAATGQVSQVIGHTSLAGPMPFY